MTTAMTAARRHGRLTRIGAQFVLALIAVFSWVVPAAAATVTPSNRVTSHLVVRNQPSGDGQEVGRLEPGEKAETVESVPRWLKVHLSDGIVGYVSKAWVEEVEAAPSPTAPAAIPAPTAATPPPNVPAPLLATSHPVDWWFVFERWLSARNNEVARVWYLSASSVVALPLLVLGLVLYLWRNQIAQFVGFNGTDCLLGCCAGAVGAWLSVATRLGQASLDVSAGRTSYYYIMRARRRS